MKDKHEKIVLTIIFMLAGINILFYISSHSSGPLIGVVILTIFAIFWWRKRRYQPIIILAIVWIAIHIVELIFLGINSHIMFVLLNIILPISLLYFGISWYSTGRMQTN